MVAIIVNDHFIVHQLSNTAGILPINTNADIGLLHFIVIVINNDIDPALEPIFHKFFNRGQFCFSNLGNIFSQSQTILAEIAVKIFCLVIFPFEFLVLDPVFSEFHRIHLCCSFHRKEKGKTGNQA